LAHFTSFEADDLGQAGDEKDIVTQSRGSPPARMAVLMAILPLPGGFVWIEAGHGGLLRVHRRQRLERRCFPGRLRR
jgi:hypothetical protein